MALIIVSLLPGCGGGGAAPVAGVARPNTGLTRFDVNVATGKVNVTPVSARTQVGKDASGRAILTGGAVSFAASDLLNVQGDSGKRHLSLTIGDNSNEGFTKARVIVGNLSNTLANVVKDSVQVSTAAGNGAIGHADGIRTAATFQNPQGIAAGLGPNAGSYFISDSGNHTIRRLWPDGTVTTFAGMAGTPGSADGNGTTARFSSPGQVAVDQSGAVYVADTGNNTIRRITPLGQVSTIAGIRGVAGQNDDRGTSATFNKPTGIAVTQDATAIYVAESNDIRKLDFQGAIGDQNDPIAYAVWHVAGNGSAGYVDGAGNVARFDKPYHLYLGRFAGYALFVTDLNNSAVRAIVDHGTPFSSDASTVTLAGANGAGTVDGAGTVARFNGPSGISGVPADQSGTGSALFISDTSSSQIRAITYSAGNGSNERGNYRVATLTSGIGFADGNGKEALFSNPVGISAVPAAGPSATLEIADQTNQRIRKLILASPGLMSAGTGSTVSEPVRLLNWDQEIPNQSGPTVAWAKNAGASGNAQASVDLDFFVPQGVSGFSFTAYVEADTTLINLPAAGSSSLTTLAGNGLPGDSDGPGGLAQFNGPYGIACSRPGSGVFNPNFRAVVADQANNRIRLIDANGSVTTLAGGSAGYVDGPARIAKFSGPRGVAVNADGGIVIADNGNRRIRKIASTPAGPIVSTIAGTGAFAVTDGAGSVAAFSDPTGICVDAGGNIYVTDALSNVVRKIIYVAGDRGAPASYAVRTIAGAPNKAGSTDGAGPTARFRAPTGIYADTDGTVYVADTNNNTVRALSRSGFETYSVTTFAGMAGSAGSTDGVGSAARFNLPAGIAGEPAQNLYVCELGSHRIRRISPLKRVVTVAGSSAGFADGQSGQFHSPIGLTVEPGGDILVSDQSNEAIRTVQRLITDGQAP